MSTKHETPSTENEMTKEAQERRAFLRKSVYAAYTTPVILSLLVNNAEAAFSWGGSGSPQGTDIDPNALPGDNK